MGLLKRNKVWWMSFMYQGRQVRRTRVRRTNDWQNRSCRKVKVQIAEGRFFETREEQDRTFGEMMDRYLKERAVLKAPKSHQRDRQALNHLRPVFGETVLAAITPKLLAGYKTQRRIEKAAPATINKELQLVRHAFNIAMREWEWCREIPCTESRWSPVHNEVDRWLTANEEEHLLASSSPWLREMIGFALNTGMRQGEILNLQWQDVDFARGTLMVMKSKNGTRRTIPLNATVYELLAAKQATTGASRGPVFRTPLGMNSKSVLGSGVLRGARSACWILRCTSSSHGRHRRWSHWRRS